MICLYNRFLIFNFFIIMNFANTNWLAVAAATIGGMVTGFLWYGVLFVDTWMAGNSITVTGEGDAIKMFKNGAEQTAGAVNPMIFNFLAMIAYALLMNWLLKRANATTLQDGATIGAVIGTISVIGIFINNLFAATATSLSMVDASYAFVLFTFMGAVLGGWQKK